MKINKNIFSMQLFALSFILLLFSCNQPSGTGTPGNGNPEETQKEYPETISTGFEKLSPDTMDFSNLTDYIGTIKNLLQPEQALTPEGYREFLSSLQEGLAKIIPQDQDFPYTLLTNEYAGKTPSDIEKKQTSTGYNTEEYNSLYQAFEESLTALNTAYPSYETAYNHYKSAYVNTPQTENFGFVRELLKEVIKDFNDDFYFEKETLENTELSRTIEECKKDQEELKTKDQSFCENETAFLTSMENFQQALSALRAYTPEEGTPPETFENVTIIYGTTDINDFISKIDENTKTINFTIPSGTLSISSESPDGQDWFKTPAILENINLIKEKMPASTEFSISYADIENTSVDINMDISFYNKDKEIISEILKDLPKLSLRVFDDGYNNVIFNDGNLYGVGIDALITKYYNANKQDKLFLDLISEATTYYFDAKEALNGKTMYTENDYNGNAYNLDINAALLMGASLKNVEIIGTNKTDKTKMPRVTNVRVSSDVSDIRFGAGSGVIDFVNTAPIQTPNLANRGKLILRSPIGNEFSINSAESLDLKYITKEDLLKGGAQIDGGYSEVHFKDTDSYNAVRFVNSPEVIYVNNQLKSGDNSRGFDATNADWEQAGNDGTLPPRNTANVSQANVKSVKSLVMKRLLDDNQRVYG